MRDVEALCKRVLVITHGRLVYDGALSRIADEFGQSKLLNIQFDGAAAPHDLDRFGDVTSRQGPVAVLQVERARVPDVLCAILDASTVIDMRLQDPPLYQITAQ